MITMDKVEKLFNKLKVFAKNAKNMNTLRFVVHESKIRVKKYKNAVSAAKLQQYYDAVIEIVNKRMRELKQ